MSFHTYINDNYPIRKTDEQKKLFRDWAVQQATSLGYTARVDSLGRKGQHNNVVIGNPHSAKVIFTAHYDTPARSLFPNLMVPRNVPLFIAYQFMVIGALIILLLCIPEGAPEANQYGEPDAQ